MVWLQGCSTGPVPASSCVVRECPAHSSVLIATLSNHSAKPVRHVGVIVGMQEFEFDFDVPLAPRRTKPNVAGTEYAQPEDNVKLACESAKAPPNCPQLKRNGYKVPWPSGVPTIMPLQADEQSVGATGDCLARLVMYSDGSGWSVSPM